MNRIEYLDAHRGIAIMLVAGFHAFTRWPDILPYGGQYSDVPIFKYGFLGVELFFVISGFVILMTLEKCDGIKHFIYRRWLRLFPAMLICTVVIYMTAGIFYERPAGDPELKNALPGLFFIEPYIWEKLFGVELRSMEGAFWSLYVEFKFYIVASIIYFLISARHLVTILFIFFVMWVISSRMINSESNQYLIYMNSLFNLLSFKYFGWFSAGASYYLYSKSQKNAWLYFGLLCTVLSSLVFAQKDIMVFLAALSISILFFISVFSVRIQQVISNRLFIYFGFISYPFYLIHEGIMISLIIKIKKYIPSTPDLLLPMLSIALVSIIAYFIASRIEKPLKIYIVESVNTIRKKGFGYR